MRYLFFIFLITFIVYYVSSPGETTYDYFTRLSQSFINGKLYLTQNPPWLNELIPQDGKYYVVYSPMPAIVLIPFVFLFKGNASQTLLSIFLGSINVGLVYILSRKLKLSIKSSFLITFFFGFGTNHWYLSSVGSAWFIAHVLAVFFLLMALIEALGKKRFWLMGLLLGVSFWSRSTVIFSVVFFYIYFWRDFWPLNKSKLKNILLFHLGLVLFILIDSWYNFVRFGSLSPLAAYNSIPNISNDPVFRDGFMNFTFIPRHLEAIFLRLPKFSDSFPYLIPSLYSMAIWFTSPALIYALKAKRSLMTVACWVAVLLTFLVISLWAGVGYAQFGYRFAQDFMPFLLILLISAIGQKPNKFVYLLIILSIIINFWGVIMVNYLNIWTM